MSAPELKLEKIVSPDKLRRKLAALAKNATEEGGKQAVRNAVLQTLRETLASGRHSAETMLKKDGHGTLCARRGIHFIVEKPVTESLESAAALLREVRAAGIKTLVGHQRRYLPPLRTARELVASGHLGRIVGANILWAGWRLVTESMSGLMDEAVVAEVARRIREVISSNAEGALEAHDVKTRTAGRVTFIEFHLVVPGTMNVSESHAVCDRIEGALRKGVEGAIITIHVEPEEKAKHPGGVPVV